MPLEQKLAGWTGPSSPTEQDKQDRTERMIRDAMKTHPPFADCSLSVFAKGSYANNTNVRSDSDVDIAVQCHEARYWEEFTPGARPSSGTTSPYVGPWTPAKLRSEIVAALKAKFGDQVDTSGTTAIRVNCSTARVEADVVPCFDFVQYFENGSTREGTKIFRTNGVGFKNYPRQQLENGRAKNTATGNRFKSVVRILKRLENAMCADGDYKDLPSFLVECLVFNCPNHIFTGTWTEQVRLALVHIYEATKGAEPTENSERWLEINKVKYLFHPSQPWTREDAKGFAVAGWNYLGLK